MRVTLRGTDASLINMLALQTRWLAIFIGWLLALLAAAAAPVQPAEIQRRLQQMPPAHPRLFLPAGAEAGLKERISHDPIAAKLLTAIVAEADRQLSSKPVERVLIGRRLLDKSRTALSRILHWGMAWRLTGQEKYATRARAELLAVAEFADWNPSHFLDVAEMTVAAAVGYDWFFATLDEPTRQRLRSAIVEKGLKPSIKANSWSRSTNNWNQVCNAGMAVGALVVAESEPVLAAEMIARAINTVPLSMHEYSPDGAYPEGPGYWAYGTTFNVILISALQGALGSDFGLRQQPGFLATADYFLHVTGPSGYYFNYADCGRGGQGVAPAMFWFAAQRQAPYLLAMERAKIAGSSSAALNLGRDRTLPLALAWMAPSAGQPETPRALSWTGRGSAPVAFHRGAWDRNASFVALKGGSPSTNHAHMDVGAFVMDADGVRWADDLGMQDYNSLESKGIQLWGKTQDAERWKVFRLGTSAHNVLMVDGQQQRVDGKAPITLAKPGRTVVETSSVYRGQLAQSHRGVVLQPDRTVRVQDEFTALGKPTTVRWAMVTRADAHVDGAGRATLKQEGKTLHLRVLEPAGMTWRIYPTDPPPAPTDARNEGTRLIGFEVLVPAGTEQRLVVQLEPATAAASDLPVQPLAAW